MILFILIFLVFVAGMAMGAVLGARAVTPRKWTLDQDVTSEGVLFFVCRASILARRRRRVLIRRVALDRAASKNPNTEFDDQLAIARSGMTQTLLQLNTNQRRIEEITRG